jgi:hypothetical protein
VVPLEHYFRFEYYFRFRNDDLAIFQVLPELIRMVWKPFAPFQQKVFAVFGNDQIFV